MEEQINKLLLEARSRREAGKHLDKTMPDRNMYTEMKEELLDFINYALFQIIKLEELEKKSLPFDKKKSKLIT